MADTKLSSHGRAQEEPSPNDTLPISSLPFDILIDIFDQARRDEGRNEVTRWLLNLTWVYRQWRIVALDCPHLWAYVIPGEHRFTKEFLKRSKQAKLKVEICSTPYPQGVIDLLLAECHRITRLYLLGASPSSCPLLSSSSPLEVLSIEFPHHGMLIGDFLRVLASIPMLVSLHIAGAFANRPLDHPPIPKIELPKLQILTLKSVPILRVIEFLSHLSTRHPIAELSISTVRTDVTEDSFLRLFSLFSRLTGGDDRPMSIHLTAIRLGTLVIKNDDSCFMSIRHTFLWGDIISMFPQLPLYRVQRMVVWVTTPKPPQEFWNIISQQANICELKMAMVTLPSFVQFLAGDVESDGQEIQFRGLRHLQLSLQVTSYSFSQQEATRSFPGWDALIRVLKLRKDSGLTLDRLTLNDLKKGWTPEGLQDLVGDVVLNSGL